MGIFDKFFNKDEKKEEHIIKVEVTPVIDSSNIKVTVTPDLSAESNATEISFDEYITPETAYLDFQYNDDKNMFEKVKNYSQQIDYASQKWGISPNIIAAMMAQESSANNPNLMQIDFNCFKGEEFSVYNFLENKYEKFVMTDNPSKYSNQDITCITKEDLNNPKTNVSMATIILASYAKRMDYNIPATIQSYNFGVKRTNNALSLVGNVDELKKDQTNLSFMNVTNQVNTVVNSDGTTKQVGDPNYLKNVMRYIHAYDEARGNETITFKHIEGDAIKETSVQILPKTS